METVWDKIANGWHYIRQEPLHFVKKVAKEWQPGKLLDIGCGTGRHSILFAKAGFNVTGIDPSKNMINLAKKESVKRKLDITFSVMSAENMTYKKEFDYAIMVAVLHAIKGKNNREKALNNMYMALKENGKGLISVINHSHPRFIDLEKETYIPWNHKGYTYKRYYYMYEPDEFKQLIENYFKIEEIHYEKNIWCVVEC